MSRLNYIHTNTGLKGKAALMITMFYMKDRNTPRILIQVSSKSVENVEVVGALIFANGLLLKWPYCRLSHVTQPI